MKLVVFDLDGTLTQTFAVDGMCFFKSFAVAFGIEGIDTNWSNYAHATDSNVIEEVFAERFGRAPKPSEITTFVRCFIGLLDEHHASTPVSFGQIPGATSLLDNLGGDSEWATAIATGGWEKSAQFKMKAARLHTDHLPMAFAEDGPSRESIVKTAVERALTLYEQAEFERVLMVGDAVWDARTASRLNFPLVGVGTGNRAEVLRQVGVSHVVENFLDHPRCVECFNEAAVPSTQGATEQEP